MKSINNKKGRMMWYILAIILGCAVIFMVVYFLFIGSNENWKFLRNLPVNYTGEDKLVGLENMSEEELAALNCNVVGRINEDSYISVTGVKSKLFYEEGEIYLDVTGWFSGLYSDDTKVGVIKDKKVLIENKFLGGSGVEENKEEGVPGLREFNLLNGAFLLYGTYFCKSDVSIGDSCIEKCELYDGTCDSEDSLRGGVSYGPLDCKDGKVCFVKWNREQLEAGGLKINQFKYVSEDKKKDISFLEAGLERVEFKGGEKGEIGFSVVNSGDSDSFCFALRSEDEKLIKKSTFNEKELNEMFSFTVLNEQVLELFAWVPGEDKKVFKRIIIDKSGRERDYRGGIGLYDPAILTYKQFMVSALKKEGSTYIVVSRSAIKIETEFFKEFYFIQSGEKIKAFARKESKDKWERLDCYSDWFQVGGILFDDLDLRVDDLKSSLKETMAGCNNV